MGSGPYAEGWRRENPDALGSRTVETVQLPHVLVTDELVDQAYVAAVNSLPSLGHPIGPEAIHAALDAVAGELWQAGFDAGRRMMTTQPGPSLR